MQRDIEATTEAQWIDACEATLDGAYRLAQAAHDHLAESKGRLVFVVPTIAMGGAAGFAPFAAAAEGIRALAKGVAKTWGKDGITVNTIAVAAPQVFGIGSEAISNALSLSPPALGTIGDPAADLAPVLVAAFERRGALRDRVDPRARRRRLDGTVNSDDTMNGRLLLQGRTAIVTGAGQGVGEGIARAMAAAGANVVIAARRVETGEPAAEAIRQRGGIRRCACSATSPSAPTSTASCRGHRAALRRARRDGAQRAQPGRSGGRGAARADETWDGLMRTAVRASFSCAQASFPHLRAAARQQLPPHHVAGRHRRQRRPRHLRRGEGRAARLREVTRSRVGAARHPRQPHRSGGHDAGDGDGVHGEPGARGDGSSGVRRCVASANRRPTSALSRCSSRATWRGS